MIGLLERGGHAAPCRAPERSGDAKPWAWVCQGAAGWTSRNPTLAQVNHRLRLAARRE